MKQIRDIHARVLAVVALVAAVGAYSLGSASADSISEPDAYALRTQVADLQGQVADLQATVGSVDFVGLDRRVGDLEDNDVSGCLAFSDYHYYREQVAPHGKRWRLPVMVWNVSRPVCRPTSAVWEPKHRALTPARGVASR